MTWADPGHPVTALLGLVLGLLLGWWVPAVVGRLPEPAPASDPEPDVEVDGAERASLPPAPPKVPYAALAARPGLAWRTAVATGLVGAVLGASAGWNGSLLVLLPLAPIGVALAYVDWHTTLLPTRIIAPAYGLVVVCVLLAGFLDDDRDLVVRAGIGWAALGGFYLLLWLVYPRGLGYGDVRLSGVLGLALGYAGTAELVVGAYGAFLLGGLGGLLLGMIKVVNRKRFPFGPFMLVAALVGVAFGPWIATALGY